MNARRLEQIIIIILLLLNIFLLSVVLTAREQDRRSRRETEASLTALLAENGIETGPDAELIQDCPARCAVTRDLEAEGRRMRGLLGDHSAEDLGGSIWFYRSGRGQASMRGTGEFDLLMTGGSVTRGSDPSRAAEKLFSGAGVTLAPSPAAPEDAGGNHVELCVCWDGCPVYNAVLSFEFSGDRLYMVSGTILFNEETERDPGAGMDSVSALVRFVELVRTEGYICSRIDALQPGYLVNVTMSGESTLTPVWRVVTDTGDFYIDAVTGRVENLG